MRKVSPKQEKAIRAAADALLAEGNEHPTNDEVRAQLGGGSIADISPVMRRWRESQQQQTGIRLQMPPAIVQAGERFVSQLWSTADAEATRALAAQQAESETRIEAIETERDEALSEITRLEATTQQLQTALEAQQATSTECAARLDALTQENHALALERERALAQLQSTQEGQAHLIAQLKDAQTSHKNLQKELVMLARSTKKGDTKK